MTKSISVGNTPKIKIESLDGDLSVVGWDGADLLIKGDDEEIRFEQTGDTVSVSSSDDLTLRVPRGASLEFTLVGGDASVRGVIGECKMKEVVGDLSIRDMGALSIDTIHGDLSLSNVKGDLYLKNVHGDVSLRDIDGNVFAETVADDLSLHSVRGNVHVKSALGDVSIHDVSGNVDLDSVADDLALRGTNGNVKVRVGEDVVVYLEPRADGEYQIDAGDDILLVLPKKADATLDMRGDRIILDWPGIESDRATARVVTLGKGSARIGLIAGGEIRVSNRADAGNSADEFGNFAGLNFDWSGLGERISRQVEQATTRAAKRAEEAARRVGRHAERHARRGKVGMEIGRWNWEPTGVPQPPKPPVPPSEPVSEDERMAILKMLAEKKITAEQAEHLLAALEGGG